MAFISNPKGKPTFPLSHHNWQKANHAIEQWLVQRHCLMVQFFDLCELVKNDSKHSQTLLADHLKNFCNALVDYCSKGHFEIFQALHLIEQNEPTTPKIYRLNLSLSTALLKTAMKCLTFSDKYGNNPAECFKSLETDLNLLGDAFAERLELEDQFIALYNQSTHWLENREKDPLISLDETLESHLI